MSKDGTMTAEQQRVEQLQQELDQAKARIAALEAVQCPISLARQESPGPKTGSVPLLLQLLVQWPGLADVLDVLPMAVAILDAPTGRPVYANAQLLRMLPETPGQAKDFSRFIHWRPFRPDGRLYRPEEVPWVRALQGETVIHEEMMFLQAAGRWTVLAVNAIPVRDAQGEIVAVVGTGEQVGRHKSADAQEHVLHRLVRLVAQGTILIRDSQDRIIYWSEGAERTYGFRSQEGVSSRSRDLLKTLLPEPLEQILTRLERDGRWEGELTHTCKDGRRVTVASQWIAHYDNQSRLAAVLEIDSDITDRKRMQESLVASYQRTRRILESITDCYLCLDSQGNVRSANERAAAYLSLTREQMIDRSIWTLLPEMVGTHFERVFNEVLARQAAAHEELPSVMNPGHWVELHAYPSEDGVEVYFRDVTARKQAEQQLHEMNEALERQVTERTAEAQQRAVQLHQLAIELTQAEQREQQRLAQILHDHLQQLLVAAKIKARVVQIGLKDDPVQDSVRQVQDLLEESITVSRSLTMDLSPPILRQEDLGPILQWLAGWIQDKHGLHVSIEASERIDLPSGEIRYLLFRGVRELLFNVVKHAGTEEAVVRAQRAEGQVLVTVADEGRGFDVAGRPVDRTVGGFGLSSLRERLEMLGGQIRVESRPGRGTRVILGVPGRLSGNAGPHAGR